MSANAAGGCAPAWNEADRLAALRSYEILDTGPEAAFDAIAGITAQLCRAPIALVGLVDDRRQWFKAASGTLVRETPLEVSFCRIAIREPGLFVVPDLARDIRFRDNPLVTGEPHLRFYAGAPLTTDAGLPIGTVCVLDTRPRPGGLTPEQGQALLAFARAVMSQLDLRRAGKALAESERRFRLVADALPHMAWSALPDGRHDYYNGRWYEFTGLAAGSTEGRDWNGVCHPQDRDEAWRRWQRSLASGEDYRIDYRLRHRTGEYRWVRTHALALRDAGGRIDRWFGTSMDIDAERRPEAAPAGSGGRHRALAAGPAVWHASSDGAVTMSWFWDDMTGQTTEDGKGTGWLERVHPGDREATLLVWNESVRTERDYRTEFRLRHAGGDYRRVEVRAVPIRNKDASIRAWIGTVVDVEERRRCASSLRDSEERLRLALEAGEMSAWEVDLASLTVSRWPGAAGEDARSSRSCHEVLGWIDPRDRERVREAARAALGDAAGTFAAEFRALAPGGATRWLAASGRVIDGGTASARLVGVCQDVTGRKGIEARPRHAGRSDMLTGLADRTLFQERLERATERDGERLALMLVDLDRFKAVNDRLGHAMGDALLRLAAARLEAVTRRGDLVARLGGDEFAVLARLAPGDAVEAAAGRMLGELRRPYQVEGRTLSCPASIGIALFPDHAGRAAELVRKADAALSAAKAGGRDGHALYRPGPADCGDHRVTLGGEIRKALRDGAFVPFYQPIVCLATGRIAGFEALARWRHPARGILAPAAFAPALDEPELAREIGRRMLGGILADIRSWLDRDIDCGTVALNVSAAEFRDPGFADRLLSRLAERGVPQSRLTIEVTETVFLGAGTQEVDATLRRLHAAGVRIALDDFGTGFASLTHLKRFPVAEIKIDRSFIRSIESDPGDDEIVSAVVRMGEGLRMLTVAEGIETIGQLRLLQKKGCGFGQGYLFARPMPADLLPRFLDEWRLRRSELIDAPAPASAPPASL